MISGIRILDNLNFNLDTLEFQKKFIRRAWTTSCAWPCFANFKYVEGFVNISY